MTLKMSTKYAIFCLSTGAIIAQEQSVKSLKTAFQQALDSHNDKDFVAFDNNGETYVRFIGGRVYPGQHYRRFTQRGTKVNVKPSEVTPATAPPLPQYVVGQNKWLADNGLKVGDMVTVTRTAESDENGWDNSWIPSMSRSVGKSFEILSVDGKSGIQLKDGSDGNSGYQYPFFVLEKVVGVKEICQDVINRIDGQKLIATRNRLMTDSTKSLFSKRPGGESVQDILVKDDPSCSVCAKGGVLLSFIRINNNVTIDELNCLIRGQSSYIINDRWPQELVTMFSKKLLDEIEIAFERDSTFYWSDKNIPDSRKEMLAGKYSEIENHSERLRAIMVDVVNGTF